MHLNNHMNQFPRPLFPKISHLILFLLTSRSSASLDKTTHNCERKKISICFQINANPNIILVTINLDSSHNRTYQPPNVIYSDAPAPFTDNISIIFSQNDKLGLKLKKKYSQRMTKSYRCSSKAPSPRSKHSWSPFSIKQKRKSEAKRKNTERNPYKTSCSLIE